MDYKQKLKDPRWQRKKSEIMMRDNFTCQQCGATDKTLNVHHITYVRCKNGEPWACPDEDLITLCEECHREIHSNPDIPFPFDEKMTKEFIKERQLEPYDIIGDFVRREGIFKYYKKPNTRIIDVERWANEWGAILEMTHYIGEFMCGLPGLLENGWEFIWGTGTFYKNKSLPWDEESLKLKDEIEEAEIKAEFYNTIGESIYNGSMGKVVTESQLKNIAFSNGAPTDSITEEECLSIVESVLLEYEYDKLNDGSYYLRPQHLPF